MAKHSWFTVIYYHPIYRTLSASIVSGVLAFFLPIASPPSPVDLDVYCENNNPKTIILNPIQREQTLKLCKENSNALIVRSQQFNAFQYFVVQWMIYLSTASGLFTLLSAFEGKPENQNIDIWREFAISLGENNLYHLCTKFGESLKDSDLVDDFTQPLSNKFWNFQSRNFVTKERLLAAMFSSYSSLSDIGKDNLKIVTDTIMKNPADMYSIDAVSMYFLYSCVKFGYKPELKQLKEIAIVHTLIEFNSPSQGSVSNGTIPDTLNSLAFDISKWEPILLKWTILAKFVKDPVVVDSIYTPTGAKPIDFTSVTDLFAQLFN
jgi:hypothetical protein